MWAWHSDCHMGRVIGRDIDGDLGGVGRAGGSRRALPFVRLSGSWSAQEQQQQLCYVLTCSLPAFATSVCFETKSARETTPVMVSVSVLSFAVEAQH